MVVVDPYSTGAMLVTELLKREFQVIALWTKEVGENLGRVVQGWSLGQTCQIRYSIYFGIFTYDQIYRTWNRGIMDCNDYSNWFRIGDGNQQWRHTDCIQLHHAGPQCECYRRGFAKGDGHPTDRHPICHYHWGLSMHRMWF